MRKIFSRPMLASVPFALLLSGCDNGGTSGGTPTPTPTPAVNLPPAFPGNGVVGIEVDENVAGVVYQAVASDPNNDPLTYSIEAVEDSARFTITADGKVSFVTPPDFDNPGNALRNNDYQLRIAANDGRGGTASLALRVRVRNTQEGIFTHKIAGGFLVPSAMAVKRNSTSVYIAERGGAVTGINLGGPFPPAGQAPNQSEYGYRQPKIGVAGTPPTHAIAGLLGMAEGTGDLADRWFTLTELPSGALRVDQYIDSARLWEGVGVVITIPPYTGLGGPSSGAPGGWIGFGPDGYLYIATGDGVGSPTLGPAQDKFSLRGKVLRIKPLATPDLIDPSVKQYTIPADNPYASGVGGAPEVWAYGFRDPRSGGFVGSDLFITDMEGPFNGELNLIRPADKGGNYGWPFFFGQRQPPAPGTFIDPVIMALGRDPIAGFLYDGPIDSLKGMYVFANTGSFWSFPYTQIEQGKTISANLSNDRNADIVPDAGTITLPSYLARANNGDIYLLDRKSGSLFALSAK